MLADRRSKTLASNFVFEWLEMTKLDEIVPDTNVFPYASGRMLSLIHIYRGSASMRLTCASSIAGSLSLFLIATSSS